jgi:hypothetical protein
LHLFTTLCFYFKYPPLGVGIFSPKPKPNRTEPKCRFFGFFGSASVFNSVYFGVQFRLQFLPQTEPIHRSNQIIYEPNNPRQQSHGPCNARGSPPQAHRARPSFRVRRPQAPRSTHFYPLSYPLSASKIQAHTATREATKGEPAVVNLQRSAVLGVLYLKDHGNSSPPRRSGLAGTPHAHTQASGSATCSLPASMRVGG